MNFACFEDFTTGQVRIGVHWAYLPHMDDWCSKTPLTPQQEEYPSWIEVSGSIPFDKIIVYGGLQSGSGNLKVLKFVRVNIFQSFPIFSSIFTMSISSHFLVCVFIMLRDAFLEKYGHQNWMEKGTLVDNGGCCFNLWSKRGRILIYFQLDTPDEF